MNLADTKLQCQFDEELIQNGDKKTSSFMAANKDHIIRTVCV